MRLREFAVHNTGNGLFLADSSGVQLGLQDVGTCGSGQLRASAHAFCAQALWCETNGSSITSDGFRGDPDDRLRQ